MQFFDGDSVTLLYDVLERVDLGKKETILSLSCQFAAPENLPPFLQRLSCSAGKSPHNLLREIPQTIESLALDFEKTDLNPTQSSPVRQTTPLPQQGTAP